MIANWIANRIKEASSHQGAIVVAAAVAVLFFAIPLTKVIDEILFWKFSKY